LLDNIIATKAAASNLDSLTFTFNTANTAANVNLSDADSVTKLKAILAEGMGTLSLVLNPVLGNASGCTVD